MRRINNIYILVIAAALPVFYSCKKQLNALPSQAVVDASLVTDQNSAQIALNGAYYRLVNAGTSLSVLSHRWSLAQELPPSMMAGWMQYGFGAVNYALNTFTPASTGDWTYAYYILNAANGTIAGVEALADTKFQDNRKKEILGEARFLRAFAHFHLLSYFAEWYNLESQNGVLLRKEPLTFGGSINQTRNTVKESYDYILEDINYAITNCADTRPVYYANKTAARALKLKVLMSRGQPADYTELITVANTIMGNASYALEPNLKDLFITKGHSSKEVILAVSPYVNQVSRKAAYEFVQSSVYIATPAFKKLLENDPRSTWMLVPCNHATVKTYNVDPYYLSKYTGAKYEEAIALRLTEVYLLKAEAIARSGGSLTEAKTLLKQVMATAGITNFTAVDNAITKDEVLYQVFLEFSRNMVAENGADWLALLRQPFAVVQQVKPAILKKEYYIYPVPATEFQLNPAFGEQNPGYPKQ